MIKNLISLFLLLLLLIPLYNCKKKPGLKKLDPTILWEKDQYEIVTGSGTRHLWSGFKIEEDFFTARKNIAKFILWREKEEEKDISINYFLKGSHVYLYINNKHTSELIPTGRWELFKTRITLSRGFNFIEFRKKAKSHLKIKAVEIAGQPTAVKPHFHLPEGEKITLFHPAGSGIMSFIGKGELRIRKIEFINGKKNILEENFKPGFLSSSIKYPFNFQALGFLQISAVSGKFNITGYTFRKNISNDKRKKNKKLLNEKPGVFIFLVDGCQAYHLGAYGYHRKTSPNIDKLAKDGVIFENAYANATFTRSSVATIFTGFFPRRHKLRVLTNRLPKGLFMLPEFLQKNGYKTTILTEAGNISRHFGFGQGVDEYRKLFWRWEDPRYLEKNILKFFNKWTDKKGPLFAYIHYREPHFPIIPPPPFLDMFKTKKSRVKQDRVILKMRKLMGEGHSFTLEEVQDVIDDYDSTIRNVDSKVGDLCKTLKRKGLYDSSLIIFTSDHGEALYEHKAWGHGHNVYEETSRVPLIVKFPKKMKLYGSIEKIVQLADIFPTIAALFGVNRYFDGQSLLECIKIKNEDDTFAFSTTFGISPSIGIRWRSWYYIICLKRNQEEKLYNLQVDRFRNVAVLKENEDIKTFFRSKLLNWLIDFDNLERTAQSVDLKKLPKAELENLRSLGYIE